MMARRPVVRSWQKTTCSCSDVEVAAVPGVGDEEGDEDAVTVVTP